MRILIDADVLLDLALDRHPHADAASRVLDAVQRGELVGVVAWHTVSNLYYILASLANRRLALQFIRDLAALVEVAPVNAGSLALALSLETKDFEDSMQVAAAIAAGVETIVTRNVRDFRRSPIPAVSPARLELRG